MFFIQAAHKGRLSECELLVKLGASVLLKNAKGQTALILVNKLVFTFCHSSYRKLSKIFFCLDMLWQAKMAASLDVACFLVQSDNSLSDEDKQKETDILVCLSLLILLTEYHITNHLICVSPCASRKDVFM